MSSAQRSSSSGVRDLRAMFEKRDSSGNLSASPDRGRSPSSSSTSRRIFDSTPESSVPRKIRSSFVSVDPSGHMASTTAADSAVPERREALNLTDEDGAETASQIKKEVSNEALRRESVPEIAEVVPEVAATSAAASPAVDKKPFDLPTREKPTEPPVDTKPVSAAEDEGVTLNPADPKDKNAVTENGALKQDAAEDVARQTSEKEAGQPTLSAQAAAVETAPLPADKQKPNASALDTKITKSKENSKATTPKSPSIGSKDTSRKPTTKAASVVQEAKEKVKSAAASTDKTSTKSTSQKPKENTKPAQLPSHLTAQTTSSSAKHESSAPKTTLAPKKALDATSRLLAPTAASSAKHEEADAPKVAPTATRKPRTSLTPASLAAVTKSTAASSARDKPRTSLASVGSSKAGESSSRQSLGSAKHTSQPSEGFLARMMKPTTASVNRTQDQSSEAEKTDTKPASKPASRPTSISSRPAGAPLGHSKKPSGRPSPANHAVKKEAKKDVANSTSKATSTDGKPAVQVEKTETKVKPNTVDATAPEVKSTDESEAPVEANLEEKAHEEKETPAAVVSAAPDSKEEAIEVPKDVAPPVEIKPTVTEPVRAPEPSSVKAEPIEVKEIKEEPTTTATEPEKLPEVVAELPISEKAEAPAEMKVQEVAEAEPTASAVALEPTAPTVVSDSKDSATSAAKTEVEAPSATPAEQAAAVNEDETY